MAKLGTSPLNGILPLPAGESPYMVAPIGRLNSVMLSRGQMTLSQLDYLPCGYKVLRSNGNEIDSFLEG